MVRRTGGNFGARRWTMLGAGALATLAGSLALGGGCLFDSTGIPGGPQGTTSDSATSTSTTSGGGATTSSTTSSTSSGTGGSPPDCEAGFTCVPDIASGNYAVEATGANQTCPTGWGGAATYT